ncbi:unnamed protein product [Gordionus sp. m RMFG-2023]
MLVSMSKISFFCNVLDPPKYFEELYNEIGFNIQKIQNKIYHLNSLTKFSHNLLVNNTNQIIPIQNEINAIVKFNTDLLNLLTQHNSELNKIEKLKLSKITNEFHEILKVYSNLQSRVFQQNYYNLIDEKSNYTDEHTPLLAKQPHIYKQIVTEERLKREDILNKRYEETLDTYSQVRELESQILDVNQIFRDLGFLVKEQGDTIDSIESHLDNVVINVETANTQLSSAIKYNVANGYK